LNSIEQEQFACKLCRGACQRPQGQKGSEMTGDARGSTQDALLSAGVAVI
jgi:hypothetical protein